jgi:hypothetical protein
MSKVTTTFEAVDTGMVATIQKIERETKSMKDTTQKTEKQVDLSFAAMAKAGAGLAIGIGLVKGAFAAITGTLDKFGEALDMGGRLSDLSASTGETAGNLLLLERAFDNSGVGADKVGTSINKLQKFMSDANRGTTKNIEVLDQLGISYSTLAQLTPTEQMGLLAEKINGINSPTERAAAAMNIFGRSGGALLPFLQNFSGEIGNAKDELGSMIGIMDAKNAVFDTVSDKISIIKGKFMEFAAGILDRVAPALELFTTILSRIDAAALGQKLADAFIGGQKAMEGFGVALDMLKIGEFGLSWKIIFKSIELQLKETFNQIYKIAVSTFDGIKAFIVSILGPNSAIINILEATFEMLGAKAGKIIISAVGGIIPGISEKVKGALEVMDSRINLSKVEIKSALQDLTPQLADAGQAFGASFDESYKSTKPLIDTVNTAFELNELKALSAIKLAKEAASILSFDMKADVQKKSFDSLKELKTEFQLLAKEQPDPLKKMKKTTDQVSIKMEKIVEKAKELTLIEKLNADLANAKATKEAGIDPLKKEAEDQIKGGKFKQAAATIKKIAIKEQEAAIRIDEEGNKDRRSLFDIARDEGINTIGKSKEELRKEILEKRKKEKPEELKKEAEKKKDAEKEKEKKAEEKADPLLEMVKAIKELVAKIEPKLPTHALAL